MTEFVEVRTQGELDKALARDNGVPVCIGDGHFTLSGSATVDASGSATVDASGSATVDASGSATVRASGSATVRASGSATVRASGSATVDAYDSATVRAYDSATVDAFKYVAVHRHTTTRSQPTVTGGVIIDVPRPKTAEEWCEYRGVEVVDGVATLYKAVHDDYRSPRGGDYTPGRTPIAEDWDGGERECGGGLHFCARPWHAREFCPDATRYVACPVALADIAVHEDASMPQKVKARACAGPVWECDEDGNRVDREAVT